MRRCVSVITRRMALQFDEQMKVIDVVQDVAEVIELGEISET